MLKKINYIYRNQLTNMRVMICWLLLGMTSIIAEESTAQFDARMNWFDEAKFGLFIHWGSYSTLGGIWKGKPISHYAEWIQANADIPKEEYAPIAKQFNPSKFDAEQWIKTAFEAGMKYLVITTKHHDGFCLWDSKYTKYDIKDASGLDLDILGELSKACKKYGVKFGTYYSIIDWHHPTQKPATGSTWEKWGEPDWVSPSSKKEYVAYMKAQLKELVDLYDTQIFWFDGDWWKNWSLEDGVDLYNYLRKIQPNAIINNRVGKRGASKLDFGTPENFTPGRKLDYYWEACWTINNSWGYKAHDKNWKSTKQLIQKLVDINSKGGNLLLNVGPTAEGEFPFGCLDRLAGMGKWLKDHTDAIYATDFAEVPLQRWGRVLQKENTYYIHVFEWPNDGQLIVDGFNAEVDSISLMGSKEKVYAKNQETSMLLSIPKEATNDYSSVIKLVVMPNSVKIFETLDIDIPVQDGDLILTANKAELTGSGPLSFEKGGNLGWWTSTDNQANWRQEIVLPGKYAVLFVYASNAKDSTFEFKVAGQKLNGIARHTGGWSEYATTMVGAVHLKDLKNYNFSLKMSEKKGEALFNLKAVILRPIK